MPKHVLKNVRIFIAGFEITSFMNNVSFASGQDAVEKTTFGDSSHTYMPGLETATAEVSGFQNFDDDSLDEVVRSLAGQRDFPFICTDSRGGDAGEGVYWIESTLGDRQPIGGTVGDASAFSLSVAPSSRGLNTGTTLEDGKTARLVTGNGTAYQVGSVSATQKAYAVLLCLTVGGTAAPSITVKLQSATDQAFTVPNDRITFAAKTTKNTYEVGNVAGAIADTWWRASWTITGTDPSFNIFVAMAIR